MDLTHVIRPDFDPEEHIYRVDGRIVPSVTEILAGVGLSDNTKAGAWEIDPDVLANAADRGTMVHLAIELDCTGELDEDTVDDEIWPYLEAWRQFVDDTGFLPVANELRFYHPRLDYCGTADMIGYMGDQLTVLDLKTGSIGLKPWHKYQLAAYAAAITKEGDTWPHRMMLHLRPELKRKRYREYNFSTESAANDWRIFSAARLVYSAKLADEKC